TRFSRDWSSDVCSSDLVANTLEIESGVNDPMAIFLTTLLIELLMASDKTLGLAMLGELVMQFGLGTVLGIVLGRALAWAMQRARSEERRVGRGWTSGGA